jgi:hypothetical protein
VAMLDGQIAHAGGAGTARAPEWIESAGQMRAVGLELRRLLIKKPLKPGKHLTNLFRSSEVRHRVGNRIMIF